MNTEQEQEYHCQICRRIHRSREDQSIFEAHKTWNPRASVKVLPEYYSRSLSALHGGHDE